MTQLNIADYYAIDEKIDRKNKRTDLFAGDPRLIRVAILGNFTLNGIKEVLNVKCDGAGYILKPYVGGYNQYHQDLLDKDSELYRFKAHITILFLDINAFLGDDYYFPYRLTEFQRRTLIKKKADEVLGLVKAFSKYSHGKLVLHNFVIPTYSSMGILENKQEFGFFEMVRGLNQTLEESLRKNREVFIFDYDLFLSKCGKGNSCDEKMRYLADMRLDQNLIPALCDEYMRYIKAVKGKTRKCIVLDLDNTLWGGVIGEDGFDGIRLSVTSPGNSFIEFQKYLLALFERGVLLAINSNNNKDEAMKAIRGHPSMVLKENCFAALRINWNNKAKNMVEIARELNIGLDSLVYIDDDKRNRQLIREMLPQVLVLELPEDPALYASALKGCREFDFVHITDEDKKRGIMYAQERRRKDTKGLFDDIEGYLAHLDIRVRIKKVDNFSVPRVSQLTLRTNQFNFTTRRYSEGEIRSIIKNKDCLVYSVGVHDRFGDSGISGLVIMKKESAGLVLDSFLLSCRVLGKGIEKAVMAFCVDAARKMKAKYLICEYRKTEKNAPAKKFLEGSRFSGFKKSGQSQFWRYDVEKGFEPPKFIKVIAK